MARQEQNNVEYFSFLCKEGKAMFYIEHKYGNDGYATWIRILRKLGVTYYHYLKLSEENCHYPSESHCLFWQKQCEGNVFDCDHKLEHQ